MYSTQCPLTLAVRTSITHNLIYLLIISGLPMDTLILDLKFSIQYSVIHLFILF